MIRHDDPFEHIASLSLLAGFCTCTRAVSPRLRKRGKRQEEEEEEVCVAKEEEADTLSTYIYGECGKKEKGRKEESVCVKTLEKNSISVCVCVCV